jgi:sulfate permease, SulP family
LAGVTERIKHIRMLGGILPLSRARALRDALAGLNLASINIPQVLGYARIAQMPVITGLYTLLLPPVAFAIFGSSRHLVVAADSATAAIFAGSLAPHAAAGSAHYAALVGMTALLTAAFLLLARIFKLGFLADFLSRTVLTGFLAGVGCQVAIAMLGDMLGLATTPGNSLVRLWQALDGLPHAGAPTVALSSAVVLIILAGKRFAPRLPLPLAAVAASIAASQVYDFGSRGIAVVGAVAGGLPPLRLPDVTWGEFLTLVPVAASCFVMIIAQSAATARLFAFRYRESEDVNADILGLSAANAVAAVSGTFVVNGSPTQTAMGERAGARSQIAQLALAAAVLAVLLFLSGELAYLPRCVLAAIVFSIAVGMIDLRTLRDIRRESPGEFALAIATAATVVILGVEQGILLAIALSLFRHVDHSYRPHTMMFAPDSTGRWVPVPATPGKVTEPGLIVYRFGADLFYANQHRFCDEARALVRQAPTPVRWFIVDSAAITDLDYSAARSLRDLVEDFKRENVEVVFGRVSRYLKSDMDRHGITPVVGESRIFPTLHQATAMAGIKSPGETSEAV